MDEGMDEGKEEGRPEEGRDVFTQATAQGGRRKGRGVRKGKQ